MIFFWQNSTLTWKRQRPTKNPHTRTPGASSTPGITKKKRTNNNHLAHYTATIHVIEPSHRCVCRYTTHFLLQWRWQQPHIVQQHRGLSSARRGQTKTEQKTESPPAQQWKSALRQPWWRRDWREPAKKVYSRGGVNGKFFGVGYYSDLLFKKKNKATKPAFDLFWNETN